MKIQTKLCLFAFILFASAIHTLADTVQQPARVLKGHLGPVHCLSFSPDGKTLASGSQDATAIIWDISTGHILHTLAAHQERVWGIDFSPNGNVLATVSSDKTIKLWNTATWQLIRLFGTSEEALGEFAPDGTLVIVDDNTSGCGFWDVATGRKVRPLPPMADIQAILFSPKGDLTLVIGTVEKHPDTMQIMNSSTGELLTTLGDARNAVFSPDGRWLIVMGHRLYLYDTTSEAGKWELRRLHPTKLPGNIGYASGVDGPPRWLSRQLTAYSEAYTEAAFSPDGKWLAIRNVLMKTVRLLDTKTWQVRHVYQHKAIVHTMAFSRDSQFLATAEDVKYDKPNAIELWAVPAY